MSDPGAPGTWNPEGLETIGRCPVCGNESRSTLYSGLYDRVFYTAPGTWTLHQCESCTSAYLDPRPTPETLEIAYRSYYTHQQAPVPPEMTFANEPVSGWRQWLRRAVRNGYGNHQYGYRLQPSLKVGFWLMCFLQVKRWILDFKLFDLPPLPRAGGRLLAYKPADDD